MSNDKLKQAINGMTLAQKKLCHGCKELVSRLEQECPDESVYDYHFVVDAMFDSGCESRVMTMLGLNVNYSSYVAPVDILLVKKSTGMPMVGHG